MEKIEFVSQGEAIITEWFKVHSRGGILVGVVVSHSCLNVGDKIEVKRGESVIYSGEIKEIKTHRFDSEQVWAGSDCGMILFPADPTVEFIRGDKIVHPIDERK